RNFSVDCFFDGGRGAWRRDVDHCCVGAGFLLRFGDSVEHRQAEMRLTALPWADAAGHFGAVGDRLLGVEGAVLAGETLANDACAGVDENGQMGPRPWCYRRKSAARPGSNCVR